MKQDFNFFKIFRIFFYYWFTFELLSHYRYVDSSHWLREDAQWITDRIFTEKNS